MDSECHVETIERRAIKASALDMEDECNAAHLFSVCCMGGPLNMPRRIRLAYTGSLFAGPSIYRIPLYTGSLYTGPAVHGLAVYGLAVLDRDVRACCIRASLLRARRIRFRCARARCIRAAVGSLHPRSQYTG